MNNENSGDSIVFPHPIPEKMRDKKELVGLTTNLANRSVNEGFSWRGEKKE